MDIQYGERKEISERGRQYVIKRSSKAVFLPKVIKILEEASQ